jgi:hypothetical protein
MGYIGNLAGKGKLVIFIKKVIFGVLMRIISFTKLLVSWGNYLEMIIIRCFNGLSDSNFWELVSKDVDPIMTIRNLSQLRGDHISINLMRKLG